MRPNLTFILLILITSMFLASVDCHAAQLYFSDDFEHGDDSFPGWDQVYSLDDGSVTLNTDNPYAGSYCGQLWYQQHSITFFQKELLELETDEVYFKFRYLMHGIVDDALKWARLHQLQWPMDGLGFEFKFDFFGTDQSALHLTTASYDGIYENHWAHCDIEFDRWYKLETYVKYNTPGLEDGICRIWVDDALIYENTSFNLRASYSSEYAAVRIPSNTRPGQPATAYALIDDVEIWDGMPSGGEDPPTVPQGIVEITSSEISSLLGIPRRKMVMSASDNAKLWILHNGSNPDTHYSDDSGATWTGIDFYNVGDHDSFDIDGSGNIHTGQRGSGGVSSYKRIASPAAGPGDYDSASDRAFSHFSGVITDAAILAHGNNVWLFTRGDSNTNIYYDVSTNNGATWSGSGTVATGLSTLNRVGAVVIDDTPYAIIWNSATPDELLFYYWNGSSFVADSDLALTLEIRNNLTRVFSVAQTTDGRVHVAYWNNGAGNRIRHVYKKRTDAGWSLPVTVDDCNSDGMVCITACGRDVYAAYLRPATHDALTLKRFDGITGTWGERVIVDDSADCRDPAFPQEVDSNSDYVPLTWIRGSGLCYYAIPLVSLERLASADNNPEDGTLAQAELAAFIDRWQAGNPLDGVLYAEVKCAAYWYMKGTMPTSAAMVDLLEEDLSNAIMLSSQDLAP